MIDLYYWTTPNSHKIVMFLEETALPYRTVPVNIQKNEQFGEENLKVAPNNKMPAIIDHAPADRGEPVKLFESAAILLYLADKTGKLMPRDVRGHFEAAQWLIWQVAGLGPMAGQALFFKRAAEQVPFVIERFTKETARLFGVLDRHLDGRDFLAGGQYSVADIATYPWAAPYNLFGQNLDDFPNVERWLDAIAERPATQRAYAIAKGLNPQAPQPILRADREAAKQTA